VSWGARLEKTPQDKTAFKVNRVNKSEHFQKKRGLASETHTTRLVESIYECEHPAAERAFGQKCSFLSIFAHFSSSRSSLLRSFALIRIHGALACRVNLKD